MPNRCVIIGNPIAGRGAGRRYAAELEQLLRRQGREVDLAWTTRPGSARAAAEHASASLVVAVGGDGTVNEVVNGLGGRRVPLAVLPAGTANVLAKELGVPRDAKQVACMIKRGSVRELDVGCVNGRRFLLMVGAGFDGAVTRRMAARRSGAIRLASYVPAIIGRLACYRFAPMEVFVDGERAGAATSVLVSNVSGYGGPFTFAADADPCDGRFRVCLFRGGRWSLLRYLWAGWRGAVGRCPGVTRLEGAHVRLESEHPVPVQADGEFVGETPVTIEMLPDSLPLIVP